MKKKKNITFEKYNKIMDKIIREDNSPVHEKLIKLLEEAGKYNLIGLRPVKRKRAK